MKSCPSRSASKGRFASLNAANLEVHPGASFPSRAKGPLPLPIRFPQGFGFCAQGQNGKPGFLPDLIRAKLVLNEVKD
jgi:hypothetical protein